jgi:hypothetical protein
MTTEMTTDIALGLIAHERAPRYPRRKVNRRVVCADGFKVSVQASAMHYAHDSSGKAPYWDLDFDATPAYPFVSCEIGNPSEDLDGVTALAEHDADGVWSWVPINVVRDLLDAHGGVTGFEAAPDQASERSGE